MNHEVCINEVLSQYYSYLKHAMIEDSKGKPFWYLEQDRKKFEEKWFDQQGIRMIKSEWIKNDQIQSVLSKLSFRDRDHFIFWLMRWS